MDANMDASSSRNFDGQKLQSEKMQEVTNSGHQIVVSEIVEYYQAKISKDMSDMVGHVINTVDAQNVLESHKMRVNLEKLRCIIRIQHVLIFLSQKN